MKESQLENMTIQFHGSNILWGTERVRGEPGTHPDPRGVKAVLFGSLEELTFMPHPKPFTCSSPSSPPYSNTSCISLDQTSYVLATISGMLFEWVQNGKRDQRYQKRKGGKRITSGLEGFMV